MNNTNYEKDALFYLRANPEKSSIEIIDNIEMSNDFKQFVCLPYFQDLYKVNLNRIWF